MNQTLLLGVSEEGQRAGRTVRSAILGLAGSPPALLLKSSHQFLSLESLALSGLWLGPPHRHQHQVWRRARCLQVQALGPDDLASVMAPLIGV